MELERDSGFVAMSSSSNISASDYLRLMFLVFNFPHVLVALWESMVPRSWMNIGRLGFVFDVTGCFCFRGEEDFFDYTCWPNPERRMRGDAVMG